MRSDNKQWFKQGMKIGVPIGLGYFAVAFSLGIMAKHAGFSAFQATLTSIVGNASAGEFALFTLVAAGGGYLEAAIMTIVANARYLLMSCALSQKLEATLPFYHRLLLGFYLTDEHFGVAVSREGYLNPFYTYGAIVVSAPGWALGTGLGVVMGNMLPANIVSALSVSLYGMFLAIFIPPAKENKVIAGVVLLAMGLSWAFSKIAVLWNISSGTQIIILTVAISLAAAILFPIKEEEESHES